MAGAVRSRLVAAAGGNPVVLQELAAALTDRQRAGVELVRCAERARS